MAVLQLCVMRSVLPSVTGCRGHKGWLQATEASLSDCATGTRACRCWCAGQQCQTPGNDACAAVQAGQDQACPRHKSNTSSSTPDSRAAKSYKLSLDKIKSQKLPVCPALLELWIPGDDTYTPTSARQSQAGWVLGCKGAGVQHCAQHQAVLPAQWGLKGLATILWHPS